MASTRDVLAVLSLVPGLVLANAHLASAAETAPPKHRVFAQPERVTRAADGRYRRQMCPTSPSGITCMSQQVMPEGWNPKLPLPKPSAGAPSSGMTPADLLNAYKIPSNAAAHGKIVAILDSPDSHAFTDLTAYRSAFNIPAMPKCSGLPTGTSPCFAQVNETGGASGGTDGGDGDGETGLDMDMISAVCPDCSILLVELDQLTDGDILTGAQTAATLGAVATSISLGGPEQGGDSTGFTTAGHLVLAASGDFGYLLVDQGATTPSWPSSSPDVISVGGTALYKNGTAYDEGIWNDGTFSTGSTGQDVTTSGCSTEYSIPSYQTTPLNGLCGTKRGTADVSAAATYFSGTTEQAIAIYATVSSGAGFIGVEGTSASSPIMAALYTRLGLATTIAGDLGWEYTHMSAYNDLGSTAYPVDPNGTALDAKTAAKCQSNALCQAKPGWDGPSGVGTPNGAALFAAAGGQSGDDGGTGDSGATDGGGTGDDGGSTGDDSGSTGDDSGGPIVTGDDSGSAPLVDSGPQTVTPDAGNAFGGGTAPSGCSCTTPGGTSSPMQDTGLAALAVGAIAILGARRRKR